MTDGGVWERTSKDKHKYLDDGDDVTNMERNPLPHTRDDLDGPIPQLNCQRRQTKGTALYTPKSKAKRLKSNTMTGILHGMEEQLGRVMHTANRTLEQMMKCIPKIATYRSMGKAAWHECMEIITMQAKTQISKGARVANFDTDSSSIGVDNRCSGCISHRIEDFEGVLSETTKSIRGFAGSKVHNVKMGTLRWK